MENRRNLAPWVTMATTGLSGGAATLSVGACAPQFSAAPTTPFCTPDTVGTNHVTPVSSLVCVTPGPRSHVRSQHLPSQGCPAARRQSRGGGWQGTALVLQTRPRLRAKTLSFLPPGRRRSVQLRPSASTSRDSPANLLEIQVGLFPEWPFGAVCTAAVHGPGSPCLRESPTGVSARWPARLPPPRPQPHPQGLRACFVLQKGLSVARRGPFEPAAVQTSCQRQLWALRPRVDFAVKAPRKL